MFYALRNVALYAMIYMCSMVNATNVSLISKPLPCVNRPYGIIPGACGSISSLQVLCAALQASGKLKRIVEEKCDNAYVRIIKAYVEHARLFCDSKPFDIVSFLKKFQLENISGAMWRILPERACISQCLSISKNDLPRCTFEASSPARLLWVNNLAPGDTFAVSDTNQHEFVLYPEQEKPLLHMLYNGQKWMLVGIHIIHVYLDPSPLYVQRLFRYYARPCNLPSKYIMDRFNIAWETHLDACVRYGDTWYVMDDATRWRASITDAWGRTVQDPDRIAGGLIDKYPGRAITLAYVPVAAAVADDIRISRGDTEEKDDVVVLQRDTPREFGKVAAALALGAVADALLVVPGAFLASLFLSEDDIWWCATWGGLALGVTSLCMHARHMMPLLKSKITYTGDGIVRKNAALKSNQSGLGPRAPMI